MMVRRLTVAAAAAFFVLAVGAATSAEGTLELRLVSETSSTITLGWDPQPGYGYLFSADGVIRSRTNDPSRSTVKFSKSYSSYEVAVIVKGLTGTYPPVSSPPPPPPAAACANGVDDDSDGKIDYPADPGCSSATDTDETDPAPPPSTSFPDASNTGVPAGTTLTTYTGPSTISTANTVISGKTMGCISVTAGGVVIRNSRIVCTGSAVNINDPDLYGKTPLLIEDSEITCNYGPGGSGVAEAHFILRRVEITACENGLSVNQDVTIEDSYIHDLDFAQGAHTDGIQLSYGSWNGTTYVCCSYNVTIRHNTILGGDDQGHFATSSIISNKAPDHNILIDSNLMAGGAYTLYCDQNSTGVNYRVINNHFSTRYSPKVGFFGASTDCSDETQSGNVIHETNQPITLG